MGSYLLKSLSDKQEVVAIFTLIVATVFSQHVWLLKSVAKVNSTFIVPDDGNPRWFVNFRLEFIKKTIFISLLLYNAFLIYYKAQYYVAQHI